MQRRIMPRVALLVPVIFSPRDSRESWGRFRDIFMAGAKLVTRCPLAAGETIVFDATLSGENVITSVPAKVAWAHREGAYVVCGLVISDGAASRDILKAIKNLLASQREAHLAKIRTGKTLPEFSVA
ncbi:MAG: PilZ domain-containing protein [Endomicrobiia bacterium]|nr:PilZ domain-containing protein [Endomicrobiia bacterium]